MIGLKNLTSPSWPIRSDTEINRLLVTCVFSRLAWNVFFLSSHWLVVSFTFIVIGHYGCLGFSFMIASITCCCLGKERVAEIKPRFMTRSWKRSKEELTWSFFFWMQGLKSHAVTMFEVGKLTDESLDSFLGELEKASSSCSPCLELFLGVDSKF